MFTRLRIISLFCLYFIPYVLGSQCECENLYQEIDALKTITDDLVNENEEIKESFHKMKESNKKRDDEISFLKDGFSEMNKKVGIEQFI